MRVSNNSLEFLLFKLNDSLINNLDNKFDSLNAGGCAVVAYMLARELCSVGINAKVVWLSSFGATKEDFDKVLVANNNSVSLRELNQSNINCAHCMVLVNGKLIDSTGVHKNRDNMTWKHYKILNIVSWDIVEPIAKNEYGWNSSFNREQIPAVENTIKNIVKDLVN